MKNVRVSNIFERFELTADTRFAAIFHFVSINLAIKIMFSVWFANVQKLFKNNKLYF